MEGFVKNVKAKLLELGSKKNETLRKFIFMLLIGICLLVILWPTDDTGDDELFSQVASNGESSEDDIGDAEAFADDMTQDEYVRSLEEKLENILANVKGVGNVDVMITLKDGGEKVVEKDVDSTLSESEDGSESHVSEETVSESYDGDTTPYVSKVLEPEISGVVVSCEGGADSEIAIKITEAVQALFDVPAHKIVVLEQK